MRIKNLLLVLLVVSISFADSIIFKKNKTLYQHQQKYIVAEGDNIIGPVPLLPIKIGDVVDFEVDDGYIKDYIYESSSLNWKVNLIGKPITLEGEGRIIKGVVVGVQGKYIILDTAKGTVITTLPSFPGRVKLQGGFKFSFAPKITFKLFSKTEGETNVKITYPVEGIDWKVRTLKKGGKVLKYLVLENKTPLSFANVDVNVEPLGITLKDVFLPAEGKKFILLKDN